LMAAESSSSQYAAVAACFGRWALDEEYKENNGTGWEPRDAHEPYEPQDRQTQACL
jgi:hypothetical protein